MFIGLVEISSSILYIRESPLCKEGGIAVSSKLK
jgi:hypothetical protein